MFIKLIFLCVFGNFLLKVTDAIREHDKYRNDYDPEKMTKKLSRSGISSDIRAKIENRDSEVFLSMNDREFNKLTPDIIAAAGEDAIKNMGPKQISMMSKKLYQGDEKNLVKIFGAMGKDQLNTAIDEISEMTNKSGEEAHLNCVQLEPLILAMKRVFGSPDTWNKQIFDKMGKEFVQCLPPDTLMDVAKNKDVFRSMLSKMNEKKQDKHKATKFDKRSMLAAATTAFGIVKDWKLEDLKSASSLATMMKPKDLKELDIGVIKGALDNLGREDWDEKRGKELVHKLKDAVNGFGAIDTWTADTVKKLGNLRASLSKKELDDLPDDTLRDSVREFGRTILPSYKKRALGKRLKTLYGHPRQWSIDHIKNAGNLLGGIETRELEEIDGDALLEALPEVKDVKLPKHKGRILAKKIQQKMGDVQNWNINAVKKMGPLMRDLPSTMLKNLKPEEAREAVKMLRKEEDVSKSKKRVLIKQLLSGGNQSRLQIKEFGDFISEFPMRQLKNINTIDDVLPVEAFGNFSNDDVNSTDVEPPHWRAVQARAVLGDLIMKAENWGPVSEMSENWELKNIKKLGRLALGLKRSDIDKLSIDSFTDFVAEFSPVSNWTLGQAKTIAKRFLQAYKSRESEMTVTDMSSLGDFVIHIINELHDTLPTETAREAVRIIGTSRESRRLPKAARRRKAKVALSILGKEPSTINSDELEDLGYLVSGLTSEEISQIKNDVFIDAMATLGDIDSLDSETTTALAEKAVEAYGGASSFDGEILHNLGHLVEGLDSAAITEIPANVVDENLHVFAEANIGADEAVVLLNKNQTSKRKRRSFDIFSKTAADLVAMGSTLLALSPSDILSISNETFLDTVAEISEIKGFSSEQLQAWAKKAVMAMGAPSSMTEDELLTLNEIAKGFTPDELSQMTFPSNEVIESFGNVRGYTSQQITKLWQTIKGGKSMTAFTGDDLAALGVIASGMSTEELGGIDLVAYQNAALELGQLDVWSVEQLETLKEKAIASFGAVYSWTPAEMSMAGAAIGSFTAHEIESITTDQLDAISANALTHIPANVFKEFSVGQLSNLSEEQVAAITDEQKSLLSSEQKNILMQIETATLGYASDTNALETNISVLFIITAFQLLFL